jgi:hypothetical protein
MLSNLRLFREMRLLNESMPGDGLSMDLDLLSETKMRN